MDFLELWEQMGISVKILMGLLALMSMASVGVYFERLFTFTQATNQSKAFAPAVAKHLKDGKLKEAIQMAGTKNYRYSHLGKVVSAGLQEYQFQQDAGVQMTKDDVVDSVRRSIQRATALTSSDLKKGMGILATIGSTAVFVGLLATTLGVINAFQGIAATGSGGLGAVSGGISEALVGTAIGLFVALPAVWFYSHLGKVVSAGLQEYQFQQDAGVDMSKDDVVDSVRRSIQRATALTSSDLKKGMGILATIGSTAVFVGLLATTLGVINAFQGIAATGSGGLGAVSGGISEALVGTAIGLFVAIPAVWFYNHLTGRLEYFTVEMDNSSSELVDYFIKKS